MISFCLEAKSNGNVFGVALSQCVIDDDSRLQDDTNPTSPPILTSASTSSRKDSTDTVGMNNTERRTSPSGSVSSTNDSGYSISPASPSSVQVQIVNELFERIARLIVDIRVGL